MSATERQNQIRHTVTDLSVPRPETDVPNAFWHTFRDSRNYWRFVVDDEPRYDVWLDTDVSRDGMGCLHVTVENVLYDVQAHAELDRVTIVSNVFDGYQPYEQAFLLNAHHYERQAREQFENHVHTAEVWVEND